MLLLENNATPIPRQEKSSLLVNKSTVSTNADEDNRAKSGI
jgi:hypothetical protein